MVGGGMAPPPLMPPLVGGGGMPPPVAGGAAAGAATIPPTGMAIGGGRVLVGFLVTFQSDPSGTFWPIHSGRLSMGRGTATSGLEVALSDASSSSRHASIHADSATGQAFVEDEGSRNGTFLNDERLPAGVRRQLRDSDRLRLGSTTFVVKLLVV